MRGFVANSQARSHADIFAFLVGPVFPDFVPHAFDPVALDLVLVLFQFASGCADDLGEIKCHGIRMGEINPKLEVNRFIEFFFLELGAAGENHHGNECECNPGKIFHDDSIYLRHIYKGIIYWLPVFAWVLNFEAIGHFSSRPLLMSEDFLHYVWKYRLWNTPELFTLRGDSVVVLHPGHHNRHAGPDFLDARLKIGGVLWAGHVEIHLRASEWYQHGHEDDPRYTNVILHVVYENDREVFLRTDGDLQVLVMGGLLIPGQWEHYLRWMQSRESIPCSSTLAGVDNLTWIQWKDRLATERLELKAGEVIREHQALKGEWEETFHRALAKAMGFRVNADPFYRLACAVPFRLIARHRDNPIQVEALLFGVAGLLPASSADEYTTLLIREYTFLASKYGLTALPPGTWNTGRVRPMNSPWRRIARFAALCMTDPPLLTRVLSEERPSEWVDVLRGEIHPFWSVHFRFDDPGAGRELKRPGDGRLGPDALAGLMINAICPFLVAWGKMHDEQSSIDRALNLLHFCGSEHHRITTLWRKNGVVVNDAFDSQSLLQLYNAYCQKKRCLDCMIGLKSMNKTRC